MVGSGFSRNAEKLQPSALAPPTWRDLRKAMHDRLYPDESSEHGESAATASCETSGALRLAQEYEAAFGPTGLHGFLRESIRDDEFRPGPMHERLLQLPWRDVFTTNWDTLLERTCPFVPEQDYSLLRNPDEIPLTASPRIVKLHGSIDTRSSLIFTEEDYRTYPARFAPFVNTVQQAMMETVFCLIGFSGDDPNFLHWSGWVRDNLGSSAPRIYLAGWLGLSIHRRRMLEARNVIPIDLARHPKAGQWLEHPEHIKHERSMDWILHTLEYGRPYNISNWPSPSRLVEASVPEYLEPIHRSSINAPKPEPGVLSRDESSVEKKVATVRELAEVWNYNRKETYPGWLTAPAAVRSKMYSTRERAPLIMEVLPNLDPAEALFVLRELTWRWETQLEPISQMEETSSKLGKAARAVLDRIDCRSREIDGKTAGIADWASIREAWVSVALALVTASRFRFDADEFDRLLSAVSPFIEEGHDNAHRICHEKCLWAIYSLDYASLEKEVAEWDTSGCDPVWMMRKAALLFEMGEFQNAQELNATALAATRTVASDDSDVSMSSRESWALYCAGTTLDFEEFWDASIEWRHRWDKLTPIKCNAPLEMNYYAEEIKGESNLTGGRPFDLGNVWQKGFSFSQGEYLRWAAAHRAVRLAEVVGLPPFIPGRVVASKNLELAARRLSPHEPELAARLILRAAGNEAKGALNYVLSRARVAIIPLDAVRRLSEVCVNVIEFILSRNFDSNARAHWVSRLSVIVEALSRFVLRLDPKRVESIFTKALGWYGNNVLAGDVLFADPVRSILARCWEALPEERREKRILDLMSTPIVGMDGFAAGLPGAGRYPDPCEVRMRNDIPVVVRTPEKGSRWNEITVNLVRGMRGSEEARRRATIRMNWLVDLQVLDGEEISEIAQALWGDDYLNSKNLPSGTDFLDWEFLVLPEPRPGLAEQRFRARWLLPDESSNGVSLRAGEVLWQVGTAITNLRIHGKPLSLSDAERSYLADVVGQWAEESIPVPIPLTGQSAPIFAGDADVEVRKAIFGLQYILLEIEVSGEIANHLLQKFRKLNKSEMPARVLSAGLVKAFPECFEEIVQLMKMELASDEKKTAKNTAEALEFWLEARYDAGIELMHPPADLVREIGFIVATQRKAALIQALRIARWVFLKGSDEQQNAIRELVTEGLGYLAKELRYDAIHDEDIDVPLLRWGCTHLSIAMAEHGFDHEPAVARWVENAKDDPLPEIRHASPTLGAYSGEV